MHTPCASDLTLGSSLVVLSALAMSNKAMRKFSATEGLAGKLAGGESLGVLGMVVVAWFAFKAYQLYMGQCKPTMKNAQLEQGLIAAGLGMGLFSLYLDYY